MIGIVVDRMNRYVRPQEFYTLRFPLLVKLDWNYILDDKLLLFPCSIWSCVVPRTRQNALQHGIDTEIAYCR